MIIYSNDERYKEKILKCKISSVKKCDINYFPTFARRLKQTHRFVRMNIHGIMNDSTTYISYSASCKSGVATKLEGGTVILSVVDMSEMN